MAGSLSCISVHESSPCHTCVCSHVVSCAKPRCVSDCPRQHRCMCRHVERLDFVSENCQPDMCEQNRALWQTALSALSPCRQKRSHSRSRTKLGRSSNHVGHDHLLGVWHHCRVDGSRTGVGPHEETRNLQRASAPYVAAITLKLWHHCVDFRLFFEVESRVPGI